MSDEQLLETTQSFEPPDDENDKKSHLNTEDSVKAEKDDIKIKDKSSEPEPRIVFHCEKCDMNESCDYVGTSPPFVNGLNFAEDCYVMRDPFAPPPFRARSKPEYFIVLGAHCVRCNKVVCKRPKCSVFYQRTFCRDCAAENLSQFPGEVQIKFKKQLTW